MITTILLNILYAGLSFITTPLRALPDVILSSEITASLSTGAGYISSLNIILPVGLILTIFSIILIAEGFIFLYKLIAWAYKKIPGIN